MRLYVGLFMIIAFTLSGCGDYPSENKKPDYDQTKEMVIDILQTDEGKKALREIMNDDKMKQQLIMESDEMKEVVTDAIASKQGTEVWKELFDDPAFATSFMTATKDGQEKLFKHLMNDAAFQKKMLELMQNPEMADQTLTLLKSQQFREYLEETIQETVESPLFQEKMIEKSKEEEKSKGKDKKDDKKTKEDENKAEDDNDEGKDNDENKDI